jgi:hypothetical protein
MQCSWWSVGLIAVSLLASRAAHGQADESTTMVSPEPPSEDSVAVVKVKRALSTATRQLESWSGSSGSS